MLTNYAVHICDFHIFPVIIHHLEGLFESIIMTAPSWLVAQLVERYTSITEIMDSNLIQAWIFFFQDSFQPLVQ